MNGFYLDDHGFENMVSDLDEVTLTATLFAGASLAVGGLVEAGVTGGIEATIGFDLNDKLTEFQDGNPIGDGKLYGAELIERISHGPQCLFDVHVEITLFMEAFLWVGLDMGFSRITLFEARERFVDIVLAEFELNAFSLKMKSMFVLITVKTCPLQQMKVGNVFVEVIQSQNIDLVRITQTW